jgi:hypothetical protein
MLAKIVKNVYKLQMIIMKASIFIPVYDTLTGDILKRLEGPRACVRDVAWHPFEHNIMTASVSLMH